MVNGMKGGWRERKKVVKKKGRKCQRKKDLRKESKQRS